MMTDITGRPRYNPEVILQDLAKAITFFSDIIAPALTVEFNEELSLDVPEAGVQVFIEDDTILVGTAVTIPGCRTMPNGDPGYPDDYDFIEKGSFTLDKKNEAIDCIVGLIAVNLNNERAEAAAMEANDGW